VRIALRLKGLVAEMISLDLLKGDQFDATYRALNPETVVPTLIDWDGPPLVQSLAILELNTLPACDSTYVGDPFLGLRLGCGSRLGRKLEHCCFLIFNHVCQEHDLPIWKFQRIMMGSRNVLIDLPKDGRRVIEHVRLPAKQPAWPPAPYRGCKGKLRSRKNANRRVGIFRRSEPASSSIEVVGSQFVANSGRT
jgi:hypothetical protein